MDPVVAKTLDILFMLHADHEQNCSTSTVRLVGPPTPTCSRPLCGHQRPLRPAARRRQRGRAGQRRHNPRTAAVRGPVHGEGQEQGGRRPPHGLSGTASEDDDPRPHLIRATPTTSWPRWADNELLDLAIGLQEKALADDYFVQRSLPERGLLHGSDPYKAMGFPGEDVHRALRDRPPARLDRPVAREMIEDPETKIGVPRALRARASATTPRPT
ncbi:citrate/2-methylcitrate synthase [Kocuria rhizophila]|nr:citrate/2-methylcitrate synthase [Kocuria rhizophila]